MDTITHGIAGALIAKSFASGEKAVAHCLVKRRWFPTRFRQITIERAVDPLLTRSKVVSQVHPAEQ